MSTKQIIYVLRRLRRGSYGEITSNEAVGAYITREAAENVVAKRRWRYLTDYDIEELELQQ